MSPEEEQNWDVQPFPDDFTDAEADFAFYQRMRDMVSRQQGKFDAVTNNLERIVDAANEAHLLTPGHPSSIPREDFTLDPIPSSIVEGQLETYRRLTIHSPKSKRFKVDEHKYKRFHSGNILMNALDDEDIHPDHRHGNPLVFAATGIFGKRKIQVTMDRLRQMRLTVEFEKRKIDRKPLQYRFKPLPLDGNTEEEGFLALYLLRSCYLAMFDPAIEGESSTQQTQ